VAGVQRARQLQVVDAQGRVLENLGEPGEYRDIALSHDGTRLAFEEVDPETGTRDVWMHNLLRGTRMRLSQHPADETSPMWAPDDGAVYFMSNRDQQIVLLRRPVDSSGQEQLVLTFDVPIRPTAITADGRGLFYEQLDQLNGWDLWWRPLDGGPPQPYLQSPFHDHEPVPSPDGRFVAYASPDSGGRQVYLGTRTPSERRWQVSADYGREPLWRADGRELFFHGKDRQLMAVRVAVADGEPVVGRPRPLFELRFRGYDLRYHYAPLPDGRRFILNAPVPGSTALPATIVVRR
jgi:Tol biopolymer transport system component